MQNSLEGEGPQGNGEGPEVPRHCVLIAEKHFLPLVTSGVSMHREKTVHLGGTCFLGSHCLLFFFS